ncbi:MAG: hypothetical protein KAJ46_05350 [Sedimentisphaerales bacterium]|nr:hypothetical protein [Sedimentisphaerales bacterium]
MSISGITFNDEKLFGVGEHKLKLLSWRRETIERGFAGLDGVVSIDLGLRERKLKQQGRLSAVSTAALLKLMKEITNYIDGQAYKLVDQYGTVYEQVRMDSFTVPGSITSANQACCEYEIIYTQLSA